MYYVYMITETEPITTSHNALARFGHALSDPTRVQILTLLSEKPYYPADMAEILEVTRQSISNHLACLRGCGLVVTTADGRRSQYKLADERIKHALKDLQAVVLHVDPRHDI
jgi:DNA-binding transcriptional ArsR family regulator